MKSAVFAVALCVANAMEMNHNHNHNNNSSEMVMDPSPMAMNAHASHGRPILDDPHLEPQQRAYWEQYSTLSFFNSDKGSSLLLYSHTLLALAVWGVLWPLCMMIATDSRASWFYVPLQTLTSLGALAVLLTFGAYQTSAPDLYPGNIYGLYLLILTSVVAVHYLALVTKSLARNLSGGFDGAEYILAGDEGRTSNDSGHELTSEEEDEQLDYESQVPASRANAGNFAGFAPANARTSRLISKFAQYPVLVKISQSFGALASSIHAVLTYLLFFGGFGALLIGAAVGSCMGKGHAVFALLAHFIKGGVFFLLGFVELARYFGWLSDHGMAWNEPPSIGQKFTRRPAKRLWIRKVLPDPLSMEFLQSFLIFFYGTTNIFLEHLGNNDGAWSHKDLQHASIAFMFIGGGLFGMVVESGTIRSLLGSAFNVSFGTSRTVNPMPAFTIFWTGALMSRHQQETELATAIHVQWGMLLSLAAVLRMLTYLLFYVRDNTAQDMTLPQRPLTEILVSFCLICGGMIFMLSNRETVEAMLYRGIDSMFMLNVSVGITTLLMVLAASLFAIKGVAIRRSRL